MADNSISAEHDLADLWREAQNRRGEFFVAFLKSIFCFKAHQRNNEYRASPDDAPGAAHFKDAA
jgi:hypothetical protein